MKKFIIMAVILVSFLGIAVQAKALVKWAITKADTTEKGEITKYVDSSNGVTCYTYGNLYTANGNGVGISCVK